MSSRHRRQPAPVRDRSWGLTVALLLLTAVVGLALWLWWQQREALPPNRSVASSTGGVGAPDEVAPPAQPLPEAAPPAQSAGSSPKYPIAPAQPGPADQARPKPTPAEIDAQVRPALDELAGSQGVSEFLQAGGFVQRVVATVDNLTRPHAPGAAWPMQPAAGQFTVTGQGDDRTIDPANSARYTPFVRFVQAIDSARAAALYRKHYPLFQQAYEDLGYPGQYFNDRLVAVIDHLLQAPEPASPPKVTRVEIKGPYASERPWTRFEFVDPELEALSSGQKMMIRMGVDNEQRVKAKLREVRIAVAG